jgi:4-hydroxy-3-polyprenylbenzoate decarboxylase
LLQAAFPEIEDYWLPWEGVFHNIVIVSIDKAYPLHAQQVMSGLWGQGQMSFCKIIVVVDRDVNPQDPGQVVTKLLTQLDVSADLTFTRGVLDVLDHSSPTPIHGSKLGVDLTARVAGETPRQTVGVLANQLPSSPEKLEAQVAARIPGVVGLRMFPDDRHGREDQIPLLMVKVLKPGDRAGRDYARQLLDLEALAAFKLMLLYDAYIDLEDNSLVLWKLFNNTDPGRDIHFADDRCVVDACKKDASDGHLREWPDELTFDI